MLIHFFFIYMNEGVKAIYSIAFGFLKFHQKVFKKCESFEELKRRLEERAGNLSRNERIAIRSVRGIFFIFGSI